MLGKCIKLYPAVFIWISLSSIITEKESWISRFKYSGALLNERTCTLEFTLMKLHQIEWAEDQLAVSYSYWTIDLLCAGLTAKTSKSIG